MWLGWCILRNRVDVDVEVDVCRVYYYVGGWHCCFGWSSFNTNTHSTFSSWFEFSTLRVKLLVWFRRRGKLSSYFEVMLNARLCHAPFSYCYQSKTFYPFWVLRISRPYSCSHLQTFSKFRICAIIFCNEHPKLVGSGWDDAISMPSHSNTYSSKFCFVALQIATSVFCSQQLLTPLVELDSTYYCLKVGMLLFFFRVSRFSSPSGWLTRWRGWSVLMTRRSWAGWLTRTMQKCNDIMNLIFKYFKKELCNATTWTNALYIYNFISK